MSVPDHLGGRRPRARLLTALMLGVLALLAARLFHLQIVRGAEYSWQARENMVRRDPIPPLRGRVLDRTGRVLADNRVCFSASLEAAHPAYELDARLELAAREVAAVLDRDPDELAERFRRQRRHSEPLPLARDLVPTRLAPLVERLDPIPGLTIGREPVRWYPGGTLAAHLLGYVDEVTEEELAQPIAGRVYRRGATIGRAGLERQYEHLLRGEEGVTYIEVDALGRKTDLFPQHPPQASVPGADLHLSLDMDVQIAAERALEAAVPYLHEPGSARGAVVALDPWTGDLLACASAPAFDPNAFARGLTQAEWDSLGRRDHALRNRAIQASYPPGSVFKIVTSLAGLALGEVTLHTRYASCTGGYRFGNRSFGCWKEGGHGSLSLLPAFEQSCDVFYYQLGRALSLRRFLEYAATLAIDAPTGVDLPQERAGLVPDVAWYRQRLGHNPPEGIMLNLAIGQGEILLTPVEIASFVAAVVSDGRVRRPRVALQARDRSGAVLWDAGPPQVTRELPLPEHDRLLVRGLLREVVEGEHGTGKRARVEGYAVGGKTGTAQNPHGEDHALFVGVAPIDAPRIVVAVVVESSGHGGTMAAPVAQAVMDVFLNGPPTEEELAAARPPIEVVGD